MFLGGDVLLFAGELLERADENAHALVRRVVGALVDLNEYTLVFVRAKG